MAGSLILAACAPGEVRCALLESGLLSGYALWRPGSPDGFGDCHLGRIIARVPALGGAFVALAGDRAGDEGFLPDSAGGREATEGERLTVRITRSAQGGKGPRLARTDLTLPDGSLRLLPDGSLRLLSRGPDPLRALAAAYPDARIEIDDAALVPGLRADLGDRVRLVARAFGLPLEEEVAALAEPWVDLPGGARLCIQPTRALTAIDIDAGAMTAARGTKTAAQAALNEALLPELARQIRLRNLSGAIVVDLAGMPARRRAALAPALAEALAADPQQPRLLGFTALGFAEISRPRTRPPLHELLATPLAAGLAALREAATRPERALRLRAAPAVVAALQADGAGLSDLARLLVFPIMLVQDPSLSGRFWVLEETS